MHSLYPDPTEPQGGHFGAAVATGSNYRVVGASDSTVNNIAHVGQAFVYDVATNHLFATLNNPTPAVADSFGVSVATAGKYAVVGAYTDDTGAPNAGSAYLYNLSSMTPTTPIATFNNPIPGDTDLFGYAVAMSGKYVVVAAPLDDTGATNSGSAYVYDLTSMTPTTPIATLSKPSPAQNDGFGWSAAVSGNTVVVGTGVGSAYVFDLTSVTPTTPIDTLNNPTSGGFGRSVALAGKYLVMGARYDDTGALGAGAAYVYDLDSLTPTTPFVTLNNPTPGTYEYFGQSVSVSGNIVVVGVPMDNNGGTNVSTAHIYNLTSLNPAMPVAILNNPTPGYGSDFGSAVSVWGNSVVVGTPADGSAYVFDLSSMTPTTPIANLINPTPATEDGFGSSVAVSGKYVVVGVPGDDLNVEDSGSAYVYDLTSLSPTNPFAILKNPMPVRRDQIGNAVAISGNYFVVGSYHDVAFVYDMNSMTPATPIAVLPNPTPASEEDFGRSVAVSGNTVVVGSLHDGLAAYYAGAAYVYNLASPTPTTPIAVLPNPTPVSYDEFGVSVAISGNIIVVGADSDDEGAAGAGSAYVYNLNSPTPTTPIFTLNNPDPGYGDNFGFAVSMWGNTVVVGADRDDNGATDAGSAYVYNLNSPTPTTPIVTLNDPTPAENDWFGCSVAVSGNVVVVGADRDSLVAPNAGSANVYDLTSTTPTVPIDTLHNPPLRAGDYFGWSVAVSGNTVVVGAPQDDDQNYQQGSARVYTLAPARVAEIAINGGAVQRSRVTSLTVRFDQPVTAPAAAFQLKRQSDGTMVALNANVTGNTVTLSFTGGPLDFGSLADGRYTLTIDANQCSNSNGKLDGDNNGVPGGNYVLIGTPTNGLYRLCGDVNGNGTVTGADFLAFRDATINQTSMTICDFNNDGIINAADFLQFRLRFLQVI